MRWHGRLLICSLVRGGLGLGHVCNCRSRQPQTDLLS
jgi:hypothetical protein